MPNQYTKVPLHIVNPKIPDSENLKRNYTKAIFELIKDKIYPDVALLDEIIEALKKEV